MTHRLLAVTLFCTACGAAAQEHAGHGDMTAVGMAPMAAMSPMTGMFGSYTPTREASGTSWQPDSTPMEGLHMMPAPWMVMVHGYATTAIDRQGGARGSSETFTESMLMVMASRPLGQGNLGLRGMASLDPLMGKRGYPLLFQTGETADGRAPLVDRQHPHDFLMELAASYSLRLSPTSSAFVYAGLPGEPALGPPAFMHRLSGMDNPEAPLTHHWLDSTHITFGVLTAGLVVRNWKLEVSAFNGREPDQYRWNVETRRLDSASARLSWNPTPAWSLQLSHGRLASPEQLEPAVVVQRSTASASVEHSLAGKPVQTTLAWGRNRHQPGDASNGFLAESAMRVSRDTTLFGRLERVDNGELFGEDSPLHHQRFQIGKLSVVAIHEFVRLGKVKLGAGALLSRYRKPSALDGVYGRAPTSAMLFFRARLAP